MKIPLDSRVAPLNLTYDSAVLDADIESFTLHDLENEVDRILGAIRVHRLIGYDQRTYEDDRTLYLHLPEKTLAITRLPSRELFLGRGCPDYNNHCQKNPQDFVTGMWNK